MSEDLALLSNDEIRVRLLEYGFQNLPVTQTTRKILVKKLAHAMETQKSKTRRETVAVIKSSDDEDAEELKRAGKREKTPNRRATIGVVEKTKKVPATSSSNGSNSRAETPSKTTTSSSSRRSTSRATPQKIVSSSVATLQDDSDDNDVIEIPIIRRSKTPTMGKSDTVRTSYKSTVEKVAEEIVIEDDEEEKQTRSQRSSSRRKTFVAPEIIEKPAARTATPTKLARSTLSTSFNPSGTYNFTKQPAFEYNAVAEDDDYKIEDNAPYLSNFAKRLSTLKAEPINPGLGKYKSLRNEDDDDDYNGGKKYESASYRYTQQYGNTVVKPPQSQKRGVVNQMARDFDKLDRQFSIRKYVYIALLIMIVIAIYVLIFA
jgi:hypothetical protein